MKKSFLIFCLLCLPFFSIAQNQPKEGAVLLVKEPSGQFYNHVSFPQLNILVKRGKTASYKPVYNNRVVIEKVVATDNNKTYIVLKKKDGSKFFGLYTTVKANYVSAIEAGELVLVNE